MARLYLGSTRPPKGDAFLLLSALGIFMDRSEWDFLVHIVSASLLLLPRMCLAFGCRVFL